MVLEALAALLTAAPGAVQRGGGRGPGPRPAPVPRLLGRWLLTVDALRVPGAEDPSSLLAPRTERPSLTPCALLSCPAGAGSQVRISACLTAGPEAAPRPPRAAHRCPPTGPDGFLPWAKSPGSPGPGGPSCTPTVSTSGSLPACGLHPRSSGSASERLWHGAAREERSRGRGASLGLTRRCAPFKPSSHAPGGSIPSCSLLLGQDRKSVV